MCGARRKGAQSRSRPRWRKSSARPPAGARGRGAGATHASAVPADECDFGSARCACTQSTSGCGAIADGDGSAITLSCGRRSDRSEAVRPTGDRSVRAVAARWGPCPAPAPCRARCCAAFGAPRPPSHRSLRVGSAPAAPSAAPRDRGAACRSGAAAAPRLPSCRPSRAMPGSRGRPPHCARCEPRHALPDRLARATSAPAGPRARAAPVSSLSGSGPVGAGAWVSSADSASARARDVVGSAEARTSSRTGRAVAAPAPRGVGAVGPARASRWRSVPVVTRRWLAGRGERRGGARRSFSVGSTNLPRRTRRKAHG